MPSSINLKALRFDRFMHEGAAEDAGVFAEDVDSYELGIGIEVEMEHTRDREIAEKIALDHLAEFENYYSALAAMEDRLRS